MKLRIIGMTLPTLFLAVPMLTFAGQQPAKVNCYCNTGGRNQTSAKQAVQQGKGSGVTRNEVTLQGNAYRSQTSDKQTSNKDPYRIET
jgi:rhodanese-related sulfurtransferase